MTDRNGDRRRVICEARLAAITEVTEALVGQVRHRDAARLAADREDAERRLATLETELHTHHSEGRR